MKFLTPPVAGALLRAAVVASCFRGAFPPVNLPCSLLCTCPDNPHDLHNPVKTQTTLTALTTLTTQTTFPLLRPDMIDYKTHENNFVNETELKGAKVYLPFNIL